MIFATLKMRRTLGESTVDILHEEFETVRELEHFLAYNRAAILEMKVRGKITAQG